MPNRIIKESICTSEDVAKLSMGAEILFYHLMVKVDDFGVYFGNEQIVKNTCFPLKSDEIKLKQVQTWLDELINAGLLFSYVADDGKKYIQFTKWAKHQQIRAKKSKYPQFDSTCNHLLSSDGNCPRNPIQSNPNPYPIEIQSETDAARCACPFFETAWEQYPKKKGKDDVTKKAMQELEAAGEETILRAIENYKAEIAQNKTEDKFIMYGSTFFNGRWKEYANKNSDEGKKRKEHEAMMDKYLDDL